jgi:hypothetical protein
MLRTLWIGILTVAGCGAPQSTEELSERIDARGGVIEGRAGTPLAGFRLVVPAGALAEPTIVRVTLTDDPTALPTLAERVGPEFSITPPLSLAKPASVTVPMSPELVERFLQTSGDCSVWYRKGDGWQRSAQTSSITDSVTVELPELSTVAAGVRLPVASLCISCVYAACVKSGFCVHNYGVPFPVPTSPVFAVDANAVHYSGDGRSVSRYDLATGATGTMGGPSASFVWQLAAATDGTVWMASLDSLFRHFSWGTNFPQVLSTDLANDQCRSLAALTTATTETTVLVTDCGFNTLTKTGRLTVSPRLWDKSAIPVNSRPTASATTDALWMLQTEAATTQLRRYDLSGELTSFLVAPDPYFFNTTTPISSGKDASGVEVVVSAVHTIAGQNALYLFPYTKTRSPKLVSVPTSIYDVAQTPDAAGVWYIESYAPVVHYLDQATETLSSIQLATPGSSDYQGKVIESLQVMPDGSAMVATASREFLRIMPQ